jgi:hypothetical protein
MSPSSRRPGATTLAALALGLLSLLVAVSATSYAAGLAKNSVGTPQLKNGAVTGAKVKDRSIGRSDLAPGVVPRTTVVRRSLAVGESAEPARSGGLTFEAFCNASGAEGIVSTLRVVATSPTAPLNPVSGTYLVVRADQGFPVTTSPSGAATGFSQVDLIGFTPAAGTGRTTLVGSLQYADELPVTTDLATSAIGGAERRCDVAAVVTPTA